MILVEQIDIQYTAPPTAARMHADDSFVRGIMGPIGSGKSVACVMEIMARAMRQAPGSDKIRRTRWAIIRNSYPELRSTTIKTVLDWWPPALCMMRWDAPITGRIRFPLGDGTQLDTELFFLALDLPKDTKKLLSLELTGAWVNEAREIDKTIIDTVTSRVGRYPSKRAGGPTWSGVVMDTNPPDETHWWYHLAEENTPPDWKFWRQPPALFLREGQYRINFSAENIQHQPLGGDYWLRQVGGKTPEWIRVYLMGEYGTVLAGKAIFSDSWNDQLHVGDVLPLPRHEIICGWDWGLTPACVIAQVSPQGQLRILDEIIGHNIGVHQFADGFVVPLLKTKYRDCPQTHIGDPAGRQRSQTDERTVFDELARIGISVLPTNNNSPLARWEAVRYFLTRLVSGQPGLVLDRSCKTLRKGFSGGYRFRQLQVSGDTRYSEQADKNEYSHCHDALGYLCQYLREPVFYNTEPAIDAGVVAYDVVAGY